MNCVTMLAPSLVLLLRRHSHHTNVHDAKLLLAATLLHLPFGMGYHGAAAALGQLSSREALHKLPFGTVEALRKLDQTVQHLCGVALAYALSGGCLWYTALNVPPNLAWAWQIWHHDCAKDRWVWVGCSVCMYTLPILVWKRDFVNYVVAMSSIGLGAAAAFVFRLRWGHAAFHLLLGVFADALAQSVAGEKLAKIGT